MRTPLSAQGKERLETAILSQAPVSGLTHNLYKYPARFSPEFVRAVITEFTSSGDLIYDPFMGGGTTLVEACALGRNAVGTDISSLAAFVSQTKTTIFSARQLLNVEAWLHLTCPQLNVTTEVPDPEQWIRTGYQRNINDKDTWRIRKLLEIGLCCLGILDPGSERKLARCILLRTGQWALDCRSEIPTPNTFQKQFILYGQEAIDAAQEFALTIKAHPRRPQAVCLHRSAIGVENDTSVLKAGIPKLILTSPPYPGLHVLYHRWQVKGRRETAAPFWIAGTLDGDGSSFYTFGDRKQKTLDKYFDNVRAAFSSIGQVSDNGTMVVQMVAFSKPEWQLPRYLEAMSDAGFLEQDAAISTDGVEGRVWRNVPGRKWYASQLGATGGSREVVLFHRKR